MYLMIWLTWYRMMFLFTNATSDWLIDVFLLLYMWCVSTVLCEWTNCRSSFEQDREICLWKIFLLHGTSWRTTTVQGEVLWSPQSHCSVFFDIFRVMALICLVFGRWIRWLAIFVVLVLMTWRRAWRTWRGEHPTARRGRSPLSRPTCPPSWTVWRA